MRIDTRLAPFHMLIAGCGVTAIDESDALEIVRRNVFEGGELPAIAERVADIDIRHLDVLHILPNMGDVTRCGIWFPQDFSG